MKNIAKKKSKDKDLDEKEQEDKSSHKKDRTKDKKKNAPPAVPAKRPREKSRKKSPQNIANQPQPTESKKLKRKATVEATRMIRDLDEVQPPETRKRSSSIDKKQQGEQQQQQQTKFAQKSAEQSQPIEGAVARDRWTALTMWTFDGNPENEELSFNAEEIITILEMDGDNWWYARLLSGQEGYVPANYVKVISEKQFKVNEAAVSTKIASLQQKLLQAT